MLPRFATAGDTEETLRFYCQIRCRRSRSIHSKPAVKETNRRAPDSQADFKITQLVKWQAPGKTKAGETIKVHILLQAEERLPEMKKGGKCMLFLDVIDLKAQPILSHGGHLVRPPAANPRLANALGSVVAEQNKTPLRVPAEKEIRPSILIPSPPTSTSRTSRSTRQAWSRFSAITDVIPKQDWKHNYSHVGEEDRTGTIVLRDGDKIQYMVRPGGLASLTFLDGRKLFLALEK